VYLRTWHVFRMWFEDHWLMLLLLARLRLLS